MAFEEKLLELCRFLVSKSPEQKGIITQEKSEN